MARTAGKWLTAGVMLAIGAVLLGRYGQAATVPAQGPQTADDCRNEQRSYVAGVILALALTGLAFGVVYWKVMPGLWLPFAIGALALIQIVVHFRFFLHINLSTQKRDDLHLILFSTLILAIMVGGTIWLLANLAQRM